MRLRPNSTSRFVYCLEELFSFSVNRILYLVNFICFQFYGYLSQQQNMMQDYIRTSTYQRAMLDNTADFADKVRTSTLS